MRKLIFIILLFQITYWVLGQHSIKYFSKEWKETTKDNYYFIRKIDSLDNGLYFVTDSSKNGKMFKTGYYKSLNPEIEHGEFYFNFKNYDKKIYRGQYSNGELSGDWYVFDEKNQPIDTLNYDFQLINREIEKKDSSNDTINDNLLILIIERIPTFGNGVDDFIKYIDDNLYYPPRAAMYNIKGKLIIQFTIDTTGQAINITLINNVDKDIDKEAIRVIHNSPLWTAGEERGKPVRAKFTVPLNFTFR